VTQVFLTTSHMIFRKFETEDLDRLAAISGEVDGSRYIGDGEPLSHEMTELWIARSRMNVEKFGYGTGALVEKETNKLIGWAGFSGPENKLEEIIYGFTQSHWQLGLGNELLSGLITYARDELNHRSMRATVDPRNTASVRMLVKQNFELSDESYQGDPETYLYVLAL
jgi:ribosomal-protein-alanine N-acetyltransferase